MKLDQAESALKKSQDAFKQVAKQPNTLERNLVLAEHRVEIGRLQKVIAKSSKL